MLKVLIADDERIIREGLSGAIDWASLGLTLVGAARDGREALLLAQTAEPDICLVDIMMPGLNGLEFIEALRQIRPNIRFIIISGYDEFDYAQRAIKLKIFDYLLKPIDEAELERVLRSAIHSIENASSETTRISMMKDQLENVRPEAQKKFILDCIEGKCSELDTERFEALYNMRFPKRIGVLLLRLRDCIYLWEEKDRLSNDVLSQKIKQCAAEVLSSQCELLMAVINEEDGGVIVVMGLAEGASLDRLRDLLEEQIAKRLRCRAHILGGVTKGGVHSLENVFSAIRLSARENDRCIPVVRNVKRYIDEHYTEKDLTLNHIAKKFNVSTGHISRLLKQELGVTYSEYLEGRRIDRAISLLMEDGGKIYEIAEWVGYGSQHYFCAAFKKAVGMSPSEYKRRMEST